MYICAHGRPYICIYTYIYLCTWASILIFQCRPSNTTVPTYQDSLRRDYNQERGGAGAPLLGGSIERNYLISFYYLILSLSIMANKNINDFLGSGSGAPLLPPTPHVLPPAPPNRILGMRASDIDKYSR